MAPLPWESSSCERPLVATPPPLPRKAAIAGSSSGGESVSSEEASEPSEEERDDEPTVCEHQMWLCGHVARFSDADPAH